MRSSKVLLASAFAASLIAASAAGFAQSPSAPGTDQFVTVQPQGHWLASQFIGQPVTNQAGETIGDINDVLFDKSGRMATVVIGVGGFLGIGEKNVAIPFGTLNFTAAPQGKRVVSVPLSKERLQSAPEFKATEKTTFMRAKESAAEYTQKAVDKARELGDKAGRKIEEMRK
jgi:sporulation protein YlmC with PRC-barrel domain